MYEELKFIAIVYTVSAIVSLAVMGCIGYFAYGTGIDGSFAAVTIAFFFGIASILALIPYFGFIVQAIVTYYFVLPWVSKLTNTDPTNWLTMGLLVLVIISGFIVSIKGGIASRT